MALAAPALLLGGLVGVVTSILGAGGSTLTVPILVFLLGMEVHDALATALIIVTLTALVGVLSQYRLRLVNVRVGLAFAGAGLPSAVIGSWVSSAATNDLLLFLYALLLLLVAAWMIAGERWLRRRGEGAAGAGGALNSLAVVAAGFVAGALTGFFGVGAGFLKVPLLMLVGRLPVHQAVATSLLVIFLTGGASALVHVRSAQPNWEIATILTVGGMGGALLGSQVMARISGPALQRLFSYALGLVSLAILVTR